MSATLDKYLRTLSVAELEQFPTGVDGDVVVMAELARRDGIVQQFAEVAYAALLEAGRQDLALAWAAFVDDNGAPYLEFDADDLDDTDVALILRAEALGREVIGR